jgi:hypothetical protein
MEGRRNHPRRSQSIIQWLSLKAVAAIVVACIGTTITLAAWDRFTMSSPLPPRSNFDGTIAIMAPQKTQSVDIDFEGHLGQERNSVGRESPFPRTNDPALRRIDLTLTFKGKWRVSECIPWLAILEGDARISDASIQDTAEPLKIHETMTKEDELIQFFSGKVCGDSITGTQRGPLTSTIGATLKKSPIEISGYRASMRALNIYAETAGSETLDDPAGTVGNWIYFDSFGHLKHSVREVYRHGLDLVQVEASNPAIQGPSIAWKFNRQNGYTGNPYDENVYFAAIKYLPGEVAANRSLFISGALAGLAGGLLPWAGQLLLDAAATRRREDT